MVENKMSYMTTLSIGCKLAIYNERRAVIAVVELVSYSIVDGIAKMSVSVDGYAEQEVGMSELSVAKSVKLRFYTPIQLYKVNGVGYMPRVVFTMPRNYRVEPYKLEKSETLYDKARKHFFVKDGEVVNGV